MDIFEISDTKFVKKYLGGESCGVMFNMLDYNLQVSEFELR